MGTKYILKKKLNMLPCRFILGCIGNIRDLSSEANSRLISEIESHKMLGHVKEVLPLQEFPEAPESYVSEMGRLLATMVIILEKGGAYTDLHHLKQESIEVERHFSNEDGKRTFNVNPGSVGTYGICLASHKPTGGRHDSSTYAYGLHPHLLFGGDSYYERIARWTGSNLEVLEGIREGNKFPEYTDAGRLRRFKELVRTLRRSDRAVDLWV